MFKSMSNPAGIYKAFVLTEDSDTARIEKFI